MFNTFRPLIIDKYLKRLEAGVAISNAVVDQNPLIPPFFP